MGKPIRKLYILAGYRASGKTSALHIANERDDFPLFRPPSMSDFKRISEFNSELSSNSGFHSLKQLGKHSAAEHQLLGIQYDLLLPLQSLMHELVASRYSPNERNNRTPEFYTQLIAENIENGVLYKSIHHQLAQIVKMARAFDETEFSFIKSNWDANRKDWIMRVERLTGRPVEKLRSDPQYSFNLAVFGNNPTLGQKLYDFIHNSWIEALDQTGITYMSVKRSGTHYDLQLVGPSKR